MEMSLLMRVAPQHIVHVVEGALNSVTLTRNTHITCPGPPPIHSGLVIVRSARLAFLRVL